MKIHNYSLFFILTSFLVACSTPKEVLNSGLNVPKSFISTETNDAVDSLRKQNFSKAPVRKMFFTDPLLVKLLDSLVVNNFDVQLAYQRVQSSRAFLRFHQGIRLPQVGISLAPGVRRFGDYTIDGVGNYDTQFSTNLSPNQQIPTPAVPDYYVGAYSTWEVDLWGKLNSRKKAAFRRYLSSEELRKALVTDLVAHAAQLYYLLQLLDREKEIINENIVLQENALAIVNAQKESGKSNELAIELISAQLLDARNLLLEVEQSIIDTENELNILLGRYPQQIQRGPWSENTRPMASFSAGVPGELLQNRPDIRAAEWELHAANADAHAAKVAFYPNLTINASLGLQAFRSALLLEMPNSLAYSAFGGLITPLLNRRVLKADLMMAKAGQRAAYINYEKNVLVAFTEVYGIVRKGSLYEQMTRVKTEEVTVLEKSISTSKALFTSGRANYLEIITAQSNYLRSQIALLDIYARQNQNALLLYRAVGGGWE